MAASLSLGPFRLIEPIGRGGVGEVWSAEREVGLERGGESVMADIPADCTLN